MVEESAKGVIVVDKSGLAVSGKSVCPHAQGEAVVATAAFEPPKCMSCYAVCGCFSSSDAGYIRSLVKGSLSDFADAVSVKGLEHEVVLSPLPSKPELLLAVALPFAPEI